MLLALDIGNTHIMIGVYDTAQLVTSYRIATNVRPQTNMR